MNQQMAESHAQTAAVQTQKTWMVMYFPGTGDYHYMPRTDDDIQYYTGRGWVEVSAHTPEVANATS